MTTGEAARQLGVSVSTVRWYANLGRITVTRDARGRRQIDPAEVARLAAALHCARTTARGCRFCGASIPQHRVYCTKPTCQRRRTRLRQRAWAARQRTPATLADLVAGRLQAQLYE